ncbi:MAG: 30S ribosomal protein S20 [Planctomycetes bacterium]|nr:30S ribosomal protein S20 [Planctomycetota bacterium]
MAHSKQALKRARQSERSRIANKAKLSRLKTAMKSLMALVAAGDKTKASAMLPAICRSIDKAAKAGVIHKNTASRRKSSVTRAIAALK